MKKTIILNEGQEAAMGALVTFLQDPQEIAFKLTGYSGTGKSTMVETVIERLPSIMKTLQLLNPKLPTLEIRLTATTNKAAENFAQITGMDVSTIHSFLGLRVETDYRTGTTTLIPKSTTKKSHYLLFIDEYSYIDSLLLDYIFKLTEKCKIVFIGDPAQLTPVKSKGCPVAEAKFTEAKLTQVVRQAEGNPIIDLSTKFRNTVNTGEFFAFVPDGQSVIHLPREKFNDAVEKEFTRPDWRNNDSKILGWTNKCAIGFNNHVRQLVSGTPEFQVNDYAICNKFLSVGKSSFKTDQLVCITKISDPTHRHGVAGREYTLDHSAPVFVPDSLVAKTKFISSSRAAGEFSRAEEAENKWGDLRAASACTVNKSQGSTYDRVFIDLDDISRCNSGDQIARMLYVGVSRARHQVFLTGDLV